MQTSPGSISRTSCLVVAKPALDAGVFIVSSNAGPSYAGAQCNPRFFAASFRTTRLREAMGLYLTKKA